MPLRLGASPSSWFVVCRLYGVSLLRPWRHWPAPDKASGPMPQPYAPDVPLPARGPGFCRTGPAAPMACPACLA
ncbi:hypothetical protein G3N56_16030 [Desulfovibrio sulfodismutans]|uniref:Uncharacterized protein n=1 Tax=Desulfolutivibrio sulfodismutans TaxID=63561 RepID=A0A7K3NPV8_9BACT|nr:hypothetical protein [Desulfolutivibrio sulfodismutans]NDY58242.1 hypothetical protein [Desulfolutivibrio sulfodismutans]